MYSLLRRCLFLLPPEVAHAVTLHTLNALQRLGVARYFFAKPQDDPITAMGLTFKNRIGIAAGLDNNADYIHGLAALGVGHIEVGGVTPKPQPGNPKPRLFRLPEHQALINRKGFPNKGVEHLVKQLQHKPEGVMIGVNIGKNKDTPLEKAFDDYAACLHALNSVADYITVNISSPNTPGLRQLQTPEYLHALLSQIKTLQQSLPNYVPIAIKIAPDMSSDELTQVVSTCLTIQVDAIVVTNTTLSREGVDHHPMAQEAGGLSGAPLTKRALAVLQQVKAQVGEALPIIAVGGMMTPQDIQARFDAGATLVQVYTGLIYGGQRLIFSKNSK